MLPQKVLDDQIEEEVFDLLLNTDPEAMMEGQQQR